MKVLLTILLTIIGLSIYYFYSLLPVAEPTPPPEPEPVPVPEPEPEPAKTGSSTGLIVTAVFLGIGLLALLFNLRRSTDGSVEDDDMGMAPSLGSTELYKI